MKHNTWSQDFIDACLEQTGISIITDESTRSRYNVDFGKIAKGNCSGIALIESEKQAQDLIAFAYAHNLPLTCRNGGLSQSGQSLSNDSVILDLHRLDNKERISDSLWRVGAGCTWGDLINETAQSGYLPHVFPYCPELRLGGTLALGGAGANSHRSGLTVSQVQALTLVTGQGKLLHVTPNEEAFQASLCGQGQMTAILQADIHCRPFKKKLKTIHLLCPTVSAFLSAQTHFAKAEQADYLEGWCCSTTLGLHYDGQGRKPLQKWLYALQVSFEYEEHEPEISIPEGLETVTIDRTETLEFIYRYKSRFEGMRAQGYWDLPHPWFECFIEKEKLEKHLPEILNRAHPALGSGHRVFPLAQKNIPPLLSLPEGSDLYLFTILPTHIPHEQVQAVVDSLKNLGLFLQELGAKRYLSGYLGEMQEKNWSEHFGEKRNLWIDLKQKYDPNRLFSSVCFKSLFKNEKETVVNAQSIERPPTIPSAF